MTQDQQYVVATGVHAPRVSVYDVGQLAQKFERHFDSEIVDFQVLRCNRRDAVVGASRVMASAMHNAKVSRRMAWSVTSVFGPALVQTHPLHLIGPHSIAGQSTVLLHTFLHACRSEEALHISGMLRHHSCICSQIVTEDYSKMVFLCANRALEFHTRAGRHFTTRIPKAGRDLAYLPHSAELLVAGSAPELWRLSLYEGRYMPPIACSAATSVNALGVCPAHGMVAAAGDSGVLECFDTRARSGLGALDAAGAMGFSGEDLTAVRFDGSGYHVAVGTVGVRGRPSLPAAA